MTLLSSERSAELPPETRPAADGPLYGWQEPPIQIAPPSASSAGQEAIDLAAKAGLKLDPWQQHVLRVGMGEKLHARPDQLSGGQQQRVAIARALAVRPEAILFDEPTSALDPRMSAEVLGVIADLAKQGQTMMVVTHAMGFARSVGHTVHVMHAGTIAESGPPEQVFGNSQCDVTRQFLAQVKST